VDAVGGLGGKRVLDLAAGTGMVTRPVIDRGADVVAMEPDVALLATLRSRTPSAAAVRGIAEALPFRSGVFDLVTCGTAWHWFRAADAAPEVTRVLAPGGRLALFWANHRHGDGIDWEDAQSEVYDTWDRIRGSRPVDTRFGVRPEQAADDLRARGWDVAVDTWIYWTRQVTREQHLATIATHSVVVSLGDDKAQFLAEVEEALRPWPEMTQRLHGAFVVAAPPAHERGGGVGVVVASARGRTR